MTTSPVVQEVMGQVIRGFVDLVAREDALSARVG
jgi:hypothetical protein